MHRPIRLVLGGAVWFAALSAIGASVYTVRARTARDVERLSLRSAAGFDLAPGNLVFVATDRGLVHVGEVATTAPDEEAVTLTIDPPAFAALNESTQATCWRTPLSAEQAIDALLPPTIQRQAAEQIVADWREHDEVLTTVWAPIAAELFSAYLQVVRDDIEASVRRHEKQLWAIAKARGRSIAAEWPAIQQRLQPILQEHLTPVLSRLLSQALLDAPKVRIAWSIARGRNAEAYQAMLDWISEYLANMSDRDRAELNSAFARAWDAATEDEILTERFAGIGRDIVEDRELREVFAEIYREAISQNPQTDRFIRTHVLESPELRKQMYVFIELFAPTARKIAALCLFDENGATRPEVVHLVRSVALGREVCWVTLHTPDADAPALRPGSELVAGAARANP
jgi:hypothetical protein